MCNQQRQSAKPASDVLRDWARRGLDACRLRAEVLGGDLFVSPSWVVLLHLATAEDGLMLRDLARLVGGPPTLVARCVQLLADRGLIVPAPRDGQGRMELSEAGIRGVIASLQPMAGMAAG